MCLAKAYLEGNGERDLVLEEVALVKIDGKLVRISSLFGETKEVEGSVREIDFQNSSIVVEKPN